MAQFNEERVLRVHHWTDSLFSFTTTRESSFRFENGQFTMIGLRVDDRPLLRAYSMASASYEETLEFLSIKVPDGPLTSRLQHLREGDTVLVGRKPTGTLVLTNLLPGRRLYLLGTGTGLAPFMSLIKDPETYERFQHVALVHGCRVQGELAYGDLITKILPEDEFLGDRIRDQLMYYPTVTREAFRNQGRITDLLATGKLHHQLGMPPLDPREDRVMLCGGPNMLKEARQLLEGLRFTEGHQSAPGHFAIEKAFVGE